MVSLAISLAILVIFGAILGGAVHDYMKGNTVTGQKILTFAL